jgi:hypothetical protein
MQTEPLTTKNWLYNNLGNIYCFDKRIWKRFITTENH